MTGSSPKTLGWWWTALRARSEGLLFGAACLVALVSVLHARAFFHDDAYITFRYVERLLAGQGLTWTAGPPVEGFTHPAWLLQLAALGLLGIDLESASRVLGLGYLAGVLVLWRRSGAWVGPLAVFAALPGTALWAVGGLETMGFLFWSFVGGLCVLALVREPVEPDRVAEWLRDGRWARVALGGGLALGAAALHRPDGTLFVVLAPVAVSFGPRPRFAAVVAVAAAGPVLAWLAFRLTYYGALEPNPAVAKIAGIPLGLQLASFWAYCSEHAAAWLPGAAAAVIALLWRPTRLSIVVLALAVLSIAPTLLGGGDHMLGARLLLPATALLLLGAGLRWSGAGGRPPLWVQALVWLAAIGHAAHVRSPPPGRDPAAVWGRIMGEFLAEQLPPGALVAAATAGSTPYFSPDLEFIDTLGLNDRHIAVRPVDVVLNEWHGMPGHRKGDGAYVLARRPDVIIRGGAAGDDDIRFLTDVELDASRGFRAQYRPYAFTVRTPWLAELDDEHRPPDAVGRQANARLVTWVRADSPHVRALREFGVAVEQARLPDRPAIAPEPRALELEAVTRCVGDRPLVDFRWRTPGGERLVFLDVATLGEPDPAAYDVTGSTTRTLVLSEGIYDWRINVKAERWRPTDWTQLTVVPCPLATAQR